MKLARACVILVCTLLLAAPAQAERIVVSISTHQVAITSNFTGVALTLFGAIEPDAASVGRAGGGYSLVATVVGPRQTMVTWRKERIAGVWVNTQSRAIPEAPAYLAVLSNRPLSAVGSPDVLRRFQVGLMNALSSEPQTSDQTDEFRDAFVRVKREQGLYREQSNAVTFLTPTLFRAAVTLPANVPVGDYEIQLKLFADSAMIAQESTAFEIVKVGFEQYIANASREQGLLYGIATAMMALLTGWLGSIVFRRD